MSQMQEYEEIRDKMGHKKFDAILEYLEEISPNEQYNKFHKELVKLNELDSVKWEEEKKKLEQKFGIVYLSDVIYTEEGYKKFEKWYKNKKKIKKQSKTKGAR